MIERISSKMNQVPRRRPRLVVYLKIDKCPRPEDFANLDDSDVGFLERRWGGPIATENQLVAFQNDLTWRKEYETTGELGQEYISEMGEFISKSLAEKTQQVVLKIRDVFRQAWRRDSAAVHRIQVLAQASARIVAAKNGQIELIIDDLLGAACILFLRDLSAGRLGICANPHCPSPFFVRSRRTQQFCDVPICMVYSHRASAIKYWTRRREKEQVKSKKRMKNR